MLRCFRRLALRLPHRRTLASFGHPALRCAADISRLTQATLAASDRLAEAAAARNNPLENLDALSSTLCDAIDVFECARNVHPDREFVDAADAAHGELSARMAELNTDDRLYTAVVDVLQDANRVAALSPESLV